MNVKIDEIANLKSELELEKSQRQNLLSELDIMQKKLKSATKNTKIHADIADQNARN